MFLLMWAAFTAALLFLANWLFRKLGGGAVVPGRWDWRRALLGFFAMLLAAVPAWWLLDMPGEIRFTRLVQSGDYVSASLPQNRPHPLIRLDGVQVVVVLSAMLLLGLHMTVWPAYWARTAAPGTPLREAGGSTVGRFRVYGVVILVLGLVVAVGMAIAVLRPPA